MNAWIPLMLVGCLIAPASLFVHAFMLDGLKIPYPKTVGLPVALSVFGLAVRLATLVALVRLSAPTSQSRSPVLLACLASVLMLMLNETLRVVFIDAAISESLPYAIVDGAPNAIASALETLVVAYAALRGLKGPALWGCVLATAVIGVVSAPALNALIDHQRDALFPAITAHYQDPYPLKINLIIYAGFLEPTLAAFILAGLCWRRLKGGWLRRVALFTVLIVFVRGRVVSLLVYSFWIKQLLPIALLAEGQFFLETLTLGILVALAWAWLSPSARLDRQGL